MSRELPLPRWVEGDWIGAMPHVTAYAGPTSKSIRWFGRESRQRYQIDVGDQSLDVNVGQARAIAQMLLGDPVLRAGD